MGTNNSEYQLCPKCQGQGFTSRPPWVPADVHSWTSSSATHVCDVCNGAKVIVKPIVHTMVVQGIKNRCCGRCDGINDYCVSDMECEEHKTLGCETCWPRDSVSSEKPKEESQERILCAAIWYDDGKKYIFQPSNIQSGIVVSGLRHPHCKIILMSWLYPEWQNNSLQNQLKIEVNNKEIQGFLTSKSRFVDRKEAAEIWIKQGNKLEYSSKELFSEDLY